jgi:hypothetical protein
MLFQGKFFYMNKITLIVFCSLIQNWSIAQKYDYNWHLGYRSNDSIYLAHRGVTSINFNTPSLNPMFKYDSFKIIDFDWTCNDMSDEEGNYLFSYNGYTVENYLNRIIKNGEGGFSNQELFGSVTYQGGLIIPSVKIKNYFLIHDKYYNDNLYPTHISNGMRYSIVDMESNEFKGEVVIKNIEILNDTLDNGRLLAIKHSNGRDWWIIRGRYDMQSFYKFLTLNDSIILNDFQIIGNHQFSPFGCGAVTPNGNKVIYLSHYVGSELGIKTPKGFFLDILDFNRTTGLLSSPKNLFIDSIQSYLFGSSFSSNGKYLYISRINYIFQIDITRDTLILDTVAVFDGFNYISPGNVKYFTWFGFIERAPDGRIYGTTSCCTQQYLFYINKPNLKGKACDVRQHSIKITAHNNLPSFPNYRLGPIDGSTADSLGINNIPVAEFRYDQDTNEYKTIEFNNLSWFEPDEWWWDWGDGSSLYHTTVWDTSIIHNYAKDGVYQVCLRAKNMYGEHTKCKNLYIGTTGIETEINDSLNLSINPNPFNEVIIINLENYLPEKLIVNLYNLQGQLLQAKRLFEGSNLLETTNIQGGLYLLEFIERGKQIKSVKIIKY